MTLHIKAHVSSQTLTIKSEKLKSLIGKDVEVTIRERPAVHGTSRGLLRGTVIRYDDPFEPAAEPEDWEALR